MGKEQVNVALYCRIATRAQAESGEGIKGQEKRLIRFAEEKGWNVDEIYLDEGFSGNSLERPSFNKLMDDLVNRLPGAKFVVVDEAARLFRNNIMYDSFIQALKMHGKGIAFARSGVVIDFSEPDSGLIGMETNENVRTMEHVGVDDWDRPVYKCIETGVLWKDISLGKSATPELYNCGNDFDGEPCSPIKSDLVVTFKTKYEESPYRFNYMMLDRLRSDCDYYLGCGNRSKSRLCGGSVKEHIERMKELHNSFPEGQKPDWLKYERILEYEKQMSESCLQETKKGSDS